MSAFLAAHVTCLNLPSSVGVKKKDIEFVVREVNKYF